MKTPEDEAFDELARKQGAWGNGFTAKRQMAMDKINSDFDKEYKKMHEDRIKYGTSWEKDGERIDPMSVYKEPEAMDEHQTLEALKYAASKGYGRIVRENSAPFTIKESLAQPAQESVVCCQQYDTCLQPCIPRGEHLAQRTWVGLTDDEVMEMMGYDKQYGHIPQYARNFVEAISAKLKEKNT